MSANLMQASYQWSQRPADERFSTLQDLHRAASAHRKSSLERDVLYADLRIERIEGDLQIVGRKGMPTRFSHFSFGQLCSLASVPAGFLRRQPATLAAQNLNWGLKEVGKIDPGRTANLLLYRNGQWRVMAFHSEKYERVWNDEVVARLFDLPKGWRVPPARPAYPDQPGSRPATKDDLLDDRGGLGGLSINEGDMIAPAGLYASDHDMFVFLINEQAYIEAAPGGRETLSRGVFIGNSEYGAATITMFLYEHVCGNHIVWGASEVQEVRIRHVGWKPRKFASNLLAVAHQISTSSQKDDVARIQRARRHLLGEKRENVIDLVFQVGIFTRKLAEQVYVTAETHADVHGDPRSAWGYAAGATRYSQTVPYADERTEIDRGARRVLEMAWR